MGFPFVDPEFLRVSGYSGVFLVEGEFYYNAAKKTYIQSMGFYARAVALVLMKVVRNGARETLSKLCVYRKH